MTLFGGKVHTGGVMEYLIAGAVVFVCALVIWTRSSAGGGFLPFFFHWGSFYEQGVIDGFEWRANRFNVI